MNNPPQGQLIIPEPPPGVFAFKLTPDSNPILRKDPLYTPRLNQEHILKIERIEFPETGGQYVYHVGKKYPLRGFPYPRALHACEVPKRTLINFIGFLSNKDLILVYLAFAVLPRKMKAKIIERWMITYIELADRFLIEHYLQDRFLTNICQELKLFLTVFFHKLGISIEMASHFAMSFTTLIEYDSAYRLRIEDLLTETTKERMLANPVKEVKLLIEILAKRDPTRPHLVDKFNKFSLIMKYGFFFIRKPFREALKEVNFEKMQYDDIDRDLVKHWINYDFFGLTIEERLAKYPREFAPYATIK